MQNSPNLDKSLPLNSFDLDRTFKVVHFSDKLKPLGFRPLKIVNKPSKMTYELLTPDGKTYHRHQNHLIPP